MKRRRCGFESDFGRILFEPVSLFIAFEHAQINEEIQTGTEVVDKSAGFGVLCGNKSVLGLPETSEDHRARLQTKLVSLHPLLGEDDRVLLNLITLAKLIKFANSAIQQIPQFVKILSQSEASPTRLRSAFS